MRAFRSLTIASFKMFFRDKLTLFFSIGFPFLFLLIFGFVFQDEGSVSPSPYRYAYLVQNGELEVWIPELDKVFKSKGMPVSSVEEGLRKLRGGMLDVFIYLSDSKKCFYGRDGSRDQPYYSAFVEVANKMLSTEDEKFLIAMENVEYRLGGREVTSLDYTVTGVIAISLLTTGMFSAISIFSVQKKEGTLRRVQVTPVPGSIFVLSMASTRLIVGLFSTFVILFFSRLIFHTNYQIRWILLTITSTSGLISMLGLGTVISFIFNKPVAAQTAGSLIMTVMMFFSGVYFPLDFLPNFLKVLGRALPTYYVALAVRYSVGLEFLSKIGYTTIVLSLATFGILALTFAGYFSFKSEIR